MNDESDVPEYKRNLQPFRMTKRESAWVIAAWLPLGLLFAVATLIDWWPVQATAFGVALLIVSIDMWRNQQRL